LLERKLERRLQLGVALFRLPERPEPRPEEHQGEQDGSDDGPHEQQRPAIERSHVGEPPRPRRLHDGLPRATLRLSKSGTGSREDRGSGEGMGAGLLLLALLSSADPGPQSVFDEDRLGVELGGRASLGQTYWVLAAAGPSYGIDLRLRFGPHFSVGFRLEGGYSKSPDIDHPWTLHRKQLAFDVQWRFDTGPSIRPWVSLGMSFGTIDLEYDDLGFRSSAHTMDFARLGLGVDFLVGHFVALGPFVRGALGHTRLRAADDPSDADTGRSLDSLEVGVRVLFSF